MIKIKVPATSANLGPCFDCLGLALNLYNTFYVDEIDHGLIIEGCDKEYANEKNLFYVSFKTALSALHQTVSGVKIIFDSNIPLKGGLGSSATCVIGGVLAAFAIKHIKIDNNDVLKIAKTIETHPDNIVPALLGNVTASVIENDDIFYENFSVPDIYEFIALSPDMELSTEIARSVLPEEISLSDGVFNTSRAVLLALSLSKGSINNIKIACKDRFHQNYRGKLIPGFFDILDFADKNGDIASFLSGAGPTIMILNKKTNTSLKDKLQCYLNDSKMKWTIRTLNIDTNGATITVI